MNKHEKQPMINNENLPTFLDYAKITNNGKFLDRVVDDVKTLLRVIVVFFLLCLVFTIFLMLVKVISKINMMNLKVQNLY